MKTKMMISMLVLSSSALMVLSCAKNKCHDCHYDKAGAEVELGEKCGDELESLEAEGYTDTTGTYIVHCHGH
jgi:hypothetical protein